MFCIPYCALHRYMHGTSNIVFNRRTVTCIGFLYTTPMVLSKSVTVLEVDQTWAELKCRKL